MSLGAKFTNTADAILYVMIHNKYFHKSLIHRRFGFQWKAVLIRDHGDAGRRWLQHINAH